jgi:malate dehydrogenase (oxaloacetate-decarboxylating)(NADP+)
MSISREDVLEYHRRGRPGKIEVVPTKPVSTQRDLSLACTPGVAQPVSEAVEIVRERCPGLAVDAEMQADTAVVRQLIEERYPFSAVRDANVLVFPSLEAANVAYKLLDRLGGAEVIGPILLGLGAPVHVLQTGDDVENTVRMAAVAVMDAQSRGDTGPA